MGAPTLVSMMGTRDLHLKETKKIVSHLHHLRDAARLIIVVLSASHSQGIEELQCPPHPKNDIE